MGERRDVDDVWMKYIKVVRMIIRERKVMRRDEEGFEARGFGILLRVSRSQSSIVGFHTCDIMRSREL